MSNRKQRRKRQQQNARKREQRNARRQQAVQRFFFPSAEDPLLEVHFEDGVSTTDREVCLKYWQFTEPGTWTYRVSELGSATQVYRTARETCHASVLTVVCPQCAEPVTVRSRSELTQVRVWHADAFPRSETAAKVPCQDCRKVAEQARREADQAAAERQRRASEERLDNASRWITEQAHAPEPENLPHQAGDALILLAMLEILHTKDATALRPLDDLDYTLGASPSADLEAFKNLHRQKWIAPTLPATVNDFAFNDDNSVRGVYVTQVPWRLAPVLGDDTDTCLVVAEHLRLLLLNDPATLAALAADLDVATAVTYLNNLMVHKYSDHELPEHRLPDAHASFRKALDAGFTFGQLLAIAWSAAASAVAWGQRTPGLKAGSVASAAVTNLERRLGFARDRPVPEYDLPHWVTPPAARATAQRLLEQHRTEAAALDRFRRLRQTIASRTADTWEMEADLAPAPETTTAEGHGLYLHDVLDELQQETLSEDAGSALTYALVQPDGTLEICRESVDKMKRRIGQSGAGVVDRVLIEGPHQVNAYIPEMAPCTADNANPLAEGMIQLLDGSTGPLYGPTAFFSVSPHSHHPRGLDEEQQKMLEAAHDLVRLRNTGPVT